MDDSLFTYKTRGMTHVLDGELQPLSTSPDGIMSIPPGDGIMTNMPPAAPKKPFSNFRRTSLGMKWN